MRDIGEIQRDVLEIATGSRDLQSSSGNLLAELAPKTEEEEKEWDRMANEETAPTVAFRLHGALSVAMKDHFQEAEEKLKKAAHATERSLRAEWDEGNRRFKDVLREELKKCRGR